MICVCANRGQNVQIGKKVSSHRNRDMRTCTERPPWRRSRQCTRTTFDVTLVHCHLCHATRSRRVARLTNIPAVRTPVPRNSDSPTPQRLLQRCLIAIGSLDCHAMKVPRNYERRALIKRLRTNINSVSCWSMLPPCRPVCF